MFDIDFYKRVFNKGNTYLAVYNPEIIDEEGNLIKSKKYYGRI